MTPTEAEKIINDYWKSFKNLPISIMQPISDLPYSPGKIRYAHFIYGEELLKQDFLTRDISNKLSSSYADIHDKFVEDPKPINEQFKKYIKNLKNGIIDKNYQSLNIKRLEEKLSWEIEYNNFLADCQGNYRTKTKDNK